MKKLEETFKGRGDVKGFLFRKYKESDKAYIYEVMPLNGSEKHYEVFIKEYQKEKTIILDGRTVNLKEKELYPVSSKFGDTAWCIRNLSDAIDKFNEIS